MGVTEKTNGRVLIGETCSRVEIIKNVAPLRWRIECRVHDGKIAYLLLQSQTTQPFFVIVRQVFTRQLDRMLSQFIEVGGGFGERCLLIVVAFHNWTIHFEDALDAFMRVGVITDHVAQTNKVRALTLVRVRQHGLERLEIGLDITENCETHGLKTRYGVRSGIRWSCGILSLSSRNFSRVIIVGSRS